jgi:hypothetical protein
VGFHATMSRAFHRLELLLKNITPRRRSRRRSRVRRRSREEVGRLDPRRLVFVDENVAPTPLWCGATRGRPKASGPTAAGCPDNHSQITTLVASLSLAGAGETTTFQGATTKTAVFENFYVEQVLTPSLGLGQVVVVDNLGHTRGRGSKS